MFGLNGISKKISKKFSIVKYKYRIVPITIAAFSMAILITNGAYLINQFKIVQPLSYITGRIDRDDYISKYRKEYPTIQYLNKNLPKSAKILALFIGNRLYYSDREMWFSRSVFDNAVKNSDSFEKIVENLNEQGFTHILLRYDLFIDWVGYNFDSEQKIKIKKMLAGYAKLLFVENGYGLYALASDKK